MVLCWQPSGLVEQHARPVQLLAFHRHGREDQPPDTRAFRLRDRGQGPAFRSADPAVQVVDQSQVPPRLRPRQRGRGPAGRTGHTHQHGTRGVETPFPHTGRAHVCPQQGYQFRVRVQQSDGQPFP